MFIGACELTLHLPLAQSLKDKRQAIKSLMARLRNEFNIAVAEVDQQQAWQVAVLGVACVSPSQKYAHEQIEAVVRFVQTHRPDLPLTHYEIEIL